VQTFLVLLVAQHCGAASHVFAGGRIAGLKKVRCIMFPSTAHLLRCPKSGLQAIQKSLILKPLRGGAECGIEHSTPLPLKDTLKDTVGAATASGEVTLKISITYGTERVTCCMSPCVLCSCTGTENSNAESRHIKKKTRRFNLPVGCGGRA
jgi:hypothetical protein